MVKLVKIIAMLAPHGVAALKKSATRLLTSSGRVDGPFRRILEATLRISTSVLSGAVLLELAEAIVRFDLSDTGTSSFQLNSQKQSLLGGLTLVQSLSNDENLLGVIPHNEEGRLGLHHFTNPYNLWRDKLTGNKNPNPRLFSSTELVIICAHLTPTHLEVLGANHRDFNSTLNASCAEAFVLLEQCETDFALREYFEDELGLWVRPDARYGVWRTLAHQGNGREKTIDNIKSDVRNMRVRGKNFTTALSDMLEAPRDPFEYDKGLRF